MLLEKRRAHVDASMCTRVVSHDGMCSAVSNVPPHVCAVLEDVLLDAAVGSEVTVVDEIAGVHLKLTVKHADQKV